MLPPIFQTLDVPAVRALLKTGAGPLRIYSFGLAPQFPVLPYVVWQLVGGGPEVNLSQRPDNDRPTTQIDIYASPEQGADLTRQVFAALQEALELRCNIVGDFGESRDYETMNYRRSFQADWVEPR